MFYKLFSETYIDEYIDFDIEVVTSLPTIDLPMVHWRQEARNISIVEVMGTSDAAAEEANQSEEEPKIVADEDENRKITSADALKKLDEVKNFIEINGSDYLNLIFNELIEIVEQLKLKNQKQSDIRSF